MKRNLILLCAWLCMSMAAHAVLVWDGTSAPWTNGSGTEADPYLIETPQQLSYLAELTSAGVSDYKGKYFLQTQDFDMKSIVFTPIGFMNHPVYHPFSGNYNGNGKYISNLLISGDNDNRCIALFGYAVGATIDNVIVKDSFACAVSNLDYAADAAGIVAHGESVRMSNCGNMANISVNSDCAAGIISSAFGTCILTNCYNVGAVSSTSYAGGVLGYNYCTPEMIISNSATCTLINCYNTGPVSSNYCSGGVIGYSDCTIFASSVCTLVRCYNTGSVSSRSPSRSYSGGILGYSDGPCQLTDCYNMGSVSSSSSDSTSVDDSYAGGILGYLYLSMRSVLYTLTNCSNMGSVSSSASISSTSYSGGIMGYMFIFSTSDTIATCTLVHCSNIGTVSASASTSYSGGLVGRSSSFAIVNNCYARCAVKTALDSNSTSYTYGIMDDGTIQNSYFVGTLMGTSKYGISKDGNVTNGYFNSDCGASTSGKGTSKTEAQLKSASMPVILNSSQANPVWVMDTDNSNDGYPIFGVQVTPSYQITGTCDAKQGAVSGSGKYATGIVMQLTASPSEGYAFVGWSDGDKTNPRSITVGTADVTYTALFVKMHYTITIGQDCSTTIK